jgi:hypothetical protein
VKNTANTVPGRGSEIPGKGGGLPRSHKGKRLSFPLPGQNFSIAGGGSSIQTKV